MRQRQRHAFGGTLKPWRPETQEVNRRCFLGEAALMARPVDVEDRGRILGQIAYARITGGQRSRGLRIAGRALCRYPAAPHAWLAVASAAPGMEPQRMLAASRKLGRGLS